MKYLFVLLGFTAICFSCSDKKESVPPAPASVQNVKEIIKGKKYLTVRVGTLSPFAATMDKENPFNWFDEMKTTDDFTKKYEGERKKFVLQFVNDTTLRISDDNKTWDAKYEIDATQKEDETAGIRLRFSYIDKENSMSFPGANSPMTLTASYRIAAINLNSLLVEAPREFNRRPVMLWMKSK